MKNINLGIYLLLKEKKYNFNFRIRLLLNPGPILDHAALRQFTKYNSVSVLMEQRWGRVH